MSKGVKGKTTKTRKMKRNCKLIPIDKIQIIKEKLKQNIQLNTKRI